MGLENPIHIAILLIVVLLVFGAKRLPEIGQSLGSGMRGFRDSLAGHTAPTDTHIAAQAAIPVAPPAGVATPLRETGEVSASTPAHAAS